MNAAKSLRLADEVKTFTNLDMPIPILATNTKSSSTTKSIKKKSRHPLPSPTIRDSAYLPGLLKGTKPPITTDINTEVKSRPLLGFTASNLLLDGSTQQHLPNIPNNSEWPIKLLLPVLPPSLTAIDLSSQMDIPESSSDNNNHQHQHQHAINVLNNVLSPTVKNNYKVDPVMDELKKYISLMDEYSLHNFIIYDGRTLKDTPEFESFKRTYFHVWGAISFIIERLEGFLARFEIKLAVVDGRRVFELSLLNLSYLEQDDFLSCIANTEQVKPYITTLKDANTNQRERASVIIQSAIRRKLAVGRVRVMRIRRKAAVKIQSHVRLYLFRINKRNLIHVFPELLEKRYLDNEERLRTWWRACNSTPYASPFASNSTQSSNIRTRLLIYIPSITAAEYLRLDMENILALQNIHVSCLYQLADPDVHIVYITPINFGTSEIHYHNKLLDLMGVSTLPKRLHFIYPEQLDNLPQHLSLAQILLCSPIALRKIRVHVQRLQNVMIIPASVGWAEKKISTYLNIPILSSELQAGTAVQSRSFAKNVFMEASLNIPLGAHDIFLPQDLFIALSRLIATNLDIKTWILRLNYDFNNESVVLIEVDKIPLIGTIRREQAKLLVTYQNNPSQWYSRQVQLSVRKRLMEFFRDNISLHVSICRQDIYPSWDVYLKLMNKYGSVIEAEPLQKIGYVNGLCFIDPCGGIELHGGVDLVMDQHYQTQAFIRPQISTPHNALHGATQAVAKYLYENYNIIGYVTVQYIAFWDALDNIPRLWGVDLHLGITTGFYSAGIAACLVNRKDKDGGGTAYKIPRSLIPEFPQGRHVVFIPFALHSPLRGTRDDTFFKICKMRGISYDPETNVGALFFLIDAIVGGALSIYIIAGSRKRCLEIAVLATTVIAQQFGRQEADERRTWDKIVSIQMRLKHILKREV